MKDFLKNKKLLTIGVVVIALLAIPATILLVQKVQEGRSRASVTPVSLSFSPMPQNVKVGDVFEVKIVMDAGSYKITGFDITMQYSDNLAAFQLLRPSPAFDTVIINDTSGKQFIHYAAVHVGPTPPTGQIVLGVLQFKAVANGNGPLTFNNPQIVAEGNANELAVQTTPLGIDVGGNVTASGSATLTVSPPVGDPGLGASCTSDGNCLVGICMNSVCTDPATPTPSPTPPPGCHYETVVCITAPCNPILVCSTTPTSTPGPFVTHPPSPTIITQSTNGTTGLFLNVQIPGIGGNFGNKKPKNPTIPITVTIYKESNQKVAEKATKLSFNGKSFEGFVDTSDLPEGSYLVKVKLGNSLIKLIPLALTIKKNTTTFAPQITVVTGDVDHNNVLDLIDYAILINCLQEAPACTTTAKTASDLNQDGIVDEVDFSILLRGFTNREGD